MKKVLALGLALCLVLMGFTGCQQTAPVATPADTAVATDAATTADAATAAPVSGELNVAIAADIAPDSVTEWTKMFNADYPDVWICFSNRKTEMRKRSAAPSYEIVSVMSSPGRYRPFSG